MDIHFKVILLLICSLVFLVFVHIVVSRILIEKKVNYSPLLVAVKCVFFGNIPLFLSGWFLASRNGMAVYETLNIILYLLLVYNSLACGYCHIFNMGETARRIKILHELRLAGCLKYTDLKNRYGIKNIIDARIERLVAMKQISEHRGYFFLKSNLFYQISIIVLRWGFLLKYNIHLKNDFKDIFL